MRIVSQYLAACRKCTGEPVKAEEVARMCIEHGKQCAATSLDSLRVVVGHRQKWFTARPYDPKTGKICNVEKKEKN